MNKKEKLERRQEKQQLTEMYIKFDQHEVPEFQMRFRGYDRAEVDKYLSALVDAYNRMYEENQILEAELNGYRQNKDAIANALIDAKAAVGGTVCQSRPQTVNALPIIAAGHSPQRFKPIGSVPAQKDINLRNDDILFKTGG